MRITLLLLSLAAAATPVFSQSNPFTGRWDMTITTPSATYPGWMEWSAQDVLRVQPRTGSVRVMKDFKRDGDHLTVALSPQMSWELTAASGKLTGVVKRGTEELGTIVGVSAPALTRATPKRWGKPEPLFNGKDLTGWEPDQPEKNHWVAADGVLLNETKGANLRTTRKFDDFQLHVEFNCPEKGNSGIYLRGRYELQVEYEPAGSEDAFHSMGAIYGMVAPSVQSPRKPGEWESFDITLVGRKLTVLRNGLKTIDNQEIAGITGGALDSREAEPGVIYLQGDHTGNMKYRNITVALPKK